MIFEGAKEEEEVTEDTEENVDNGAPLVQEQRGSWERQGKHFLSRTKHWARESMQLGLQAGRMEIPRKESPEMKKAVVNVGEKSHGTHPQELQAWVKGDFALFFHHLGPNCLCNLPLVL